MGEKGDFNARDENKLNQMLPGNQILKSLELLAKVELIGQNIAAIAPDVKQKIGITHRNIA